ncbi:acyl-CoA dehydrogenase family protein [Streptomyces hypolithicus]
MTLLTFHQEAPRPVNTSEQTTDSLLTSTGTPPVPESPLPPGRPATTVGELTRQLFNRGDRGRVHAPWRALITTDAFRYRPGLSPMERTELSYERLRLVNGAAGPAEDLPLDPDRLASLHEWTGVVDGGLCTLVSIHYNLFLGSLVDHEDSDRRDLSDFTTMKRTGTFLCTELAHGNDASALETTAVLDRETGGFVLHTPTPGAQKFMPNTSMTGGPKSAVVAARLLIDGQDEGVFLFLTPLSDETGPLPGVRIRRLPLRTGTPMDHCLTAFDRVRLPRESLLEAEHGRLAEDGTLNSTLGNRRKRFLQSINRVSMGKICMSASSLGMARAALTIAVRYAHHRHIAGPKAGERVPLTAHRTHHARLLDGVATAYAMSFLHRSVLARWTDHTPADRADAERLTAMAKGWITWQARQITIESRERCGAQGLFPANALSDLQSNIEGGITAEGDNLVIWAKAASEMLLGHQSDRTRIPPAHVPHTPLTDLRFLRGLLAETEHLWQKRARTALRNGPTGNPLARWNTASTPALHMVSAHIRLQATDAFLTTASQTTHPPARSLLENLCRLFLLRQLTEHTGDLLAEHHLDPSHIHTLHSTTDTLHTELAPHLMTLVNAFDLPEEFLNSVPIANHGYPDQLNEPHTHPHEKDNT